MAKWLLRPLFLCMLTLSLTGGMASSAFAETEFKIRGDMDFTFGYMKNLPIENDRKNDRDFALQRVRLWITAKASDTLTGFAALRIAPFFWGQKSHRDGRDAGGALGSDGVNMRIRAMFLKIQEPGSPLMIQMGIIPLELPQETYFSGVLYTTSAGIQARYTFNEYLAAQVFWGRPYNDYLNDSESANYTSGKSLHDEMDLFGIYLPVTLNSINTKITPWAMYGKIGKDSSFYKNHVPAIASNQATKSSPLDDDGTAWWGGFAARTNVLDPLGIKLDVTYGRLDTEKKGRNFNTSGWIASMLVDYKLDNCTPGIFGWYATGSDYDKVKKDKTWGYTPVIDTFGESSNPTSFGFGANYGVQNGNAISGHLGGTWGIGVQVDDITFIPKLKHLIRFAYYRGTNDDRLARDSKYNRVGLMDATILTKSDYAWEVNFNHKYKIYENLTLSADLGYINLHRGDEWKHNDTNNAWQATTNFKYEF